MTKDEVIKLSKRPKDVPLLDKIKHKIDPKLKLESGLNPVHVKTKPLDLPKTVISHLKRHITPDPTQYTQSSPKAVISRIESHYDLNRDTKSLFRSIDVKNSKTSLRLAESVPRNRNRSTL